MKKIVRTANCILSLIFVAAAMQGYPSPQQHRTAPTQKRSAPQAEEQIVPGASVGSLRLGATETQLNSAFSWRPKPDETFSYEGPCKYKEAHWLDISLGATGVFAYIRDGAVYQITAESPRFVVEGTNLGYGTGLAEVKKLVPDGKLLRWIDSGSQANGGKDVYFWVSTVHGVAFGLYYSPTLKARRVESITVFKKDTNFQPEGCLQDPQSLVPVSIGR